MDNSDICLSIFCFIISQPYILVSKIVLHLEKAELQSYLRDYSCEEIHLDILQLSHDVNQTFQSRLKNKQKFLLSSNLTFFFLRSTLLKGYLFSELLRGQCLISPLLS